MIPGTKGDDIDSSSLINWFESALSILSNADRTYVGSSCIGAYLSRCPEGKDGIWPHESIREVIEKANNEELNRAIQYGRQNSRGVTSRHPYAGGKLERALTKKYSKDARTIQLLSPRTAGILRSIAKNYESDGERHDRDVELRY